ncbi:hypothetical protein FS935_08610 [Metabacillus litoralis]|uniref:Uncharacterized protein n=1 Tax=Metabacillus litoralis TaxID=152268 RepID=A0A5C6VZF2_9BACI|nr:hypothetical protein [Metabacillus litoralis]TXC90958.1 hypothetical protein FS935_08610 [Metabacillus litoralis]
MKKIVFIFILIFGLVGCSIETSNTTKDIKKQPIFYEIENNGLLLKAELSTNTLEPNKNLKIKATVENIGDKAVHYNSRCGNPLWISAGSPTEHLGLWDGIENNTGCRDIYNPDDIVSLEPGEILSKEITYHPKIMVDQKDLLDAPEGDYNVTFSLDTEEKINLNGHYPIVVKDTDFPLLPIKEAIDVAKQHPEVVKWMNRIDQQYEREESILTEGKWHIIFKSNHSQYDRIIIAVDYETGEVRNIHEE